MKFRLLIVVITACASILLGQTENKPRTKTHLSDIPFWAGQRTLQDHPNDSLFRDPKTNDIVVARPATSNSGPGGRETFRIVLPNRINPFIGVQFHALPNGRYEYVYTVHNGVSGGSGITSWKLDVVSLRDVRGEHGSWTAQTASRDKGMDIFPSDEAGSHQVSFDMPKGPSHAGPKQEIGPGKSQKDFRVVSTAKPGFVRAYFFGGDIQRGDARKLPDDVEAKIAEKTNPLRAGRYAFVVGPRFEPNVTQFEIVHATRIDVMRLLTLKVLDKESPFVKEIQGKMQELYDSYVSAGVLPNEFTGPSLDTHAAPQNPIERDLAVILGSKVIAK